MQSRTSPPLAVRSTVFGVRYFGRNFPLSVTLSVGTPLCLYGIAYHRVYGLSTSGGPRNLSEVRYVVYPHGLFIDKLVLRKAWKALTPTHIMEKSLPESGDL